MNDKYIMVVLGGVGPMAGLGLHREIIMNSKVNSDQKHFRVIHLSFSSMINDRCTYLEKEEIENPGEQMAKIGIEVNEFCKKFNSPCIVGVPCNTFHIDKIFDVFSETLNVLPNIKLLNMIDITVEYIVNCNVKKVGLLSTTFTRNTGLYKNKLNKNNIELVCISDNYQIILQDLIFNKVYGLKTLSYSTKKTKAKIIEFVKYLKSQGAQIIILGCTEIPIALCESKIFDVEILNPVKLLAREMIKLSNIKKLDVK